MVKLIDSTLSKLDKYNISKDYLFLFCEYIKQMGIVDLEISTQTYNTMKELPEGINFYINLGPFDRIRDYPGVYRYIIAKSSNEENCICKLQVNDIKELYLLKDVINSKFIKISGLDDLMCSDYEQVFSEIRETLKGKTVIFSPENSYNCGTALAVLWACLGGGVISTSIVGCGNLAATEEVYMAMRVINRFKQNQNIVILRKISKWFEEVTETKISNKKAIIGRKIFHVESGIHVDGILKNPQNYEPYKSELVGKKTKIVIGKHSGTSSVKIKCNELNIVLEDKVKINKILQKIKLKSMEKRGGVTDEEFKIIVKEVMGYGEEKDC